MPLGHPQVTVATEISTSWQHYDCTVRPTRLMLDGFGSYREACELDLYDIEVCAITGRNGAGKTTLFDSMLWVAYGSLPDKAADEVVNVHAKSAAVELEFDLGGETHAMGRHRSGKRSSAWYEGPDGSVKGAREVNAVAERLFRCDLELLALTAFSRQGDTGRLASLPTSERRARLAEAILRGRFDDSEKKAKDWFDSRSADLTTTVERLRQCRELADSEPDARKAAKRARRQARAAQEEAEETEAAAAGIDRERLQEAEEAEEDLRHARESLEQLPLLEELEEAEDAARVALDEAAETLEVARETSVTAAEKAAGAEAAAAGNEERIEALRRVDEGTCWVCEGVITEEMASDLIDKMEQELALADRLQRKRSKADAAVRTAQRDAKKAEDDLQAAERALDGAARKQDELQQAIKRLEPIAAKAPAMREAMRDVPSRGEVARARAARDEALRREGAAAEALRRAEKAVEELPELEEDHGEILRAHRGAKLLAGALKPAGVPHLALEQYLRSVVASANDVLSAFGALSLRFVTEGSTSRPPLRIDASLGGDVWRPYHTYSGGERIRLDIAMRIGLCRAVQIEFDTIIIDESGGALDREGTVGFSKLLSALVNRGEAGAVYAISHSRSDVDGFPSQIEVTNNGRTSRAEVLY